MRQNPKQVAAFNSNSRFNKFLAGRRGGKTLCMLERMIKRVAVSPPTVESCYMGPTMQHAKELAWSYLEQRMLELGWSFQPKIADRYFLLPGRRKLYVLGAEKYDRTRGHKFWHMAFDEIAYFTQPLGDIWRACRPCLSDYKGTADFGTTPDGKGSDAYEFFQKYKGRTNWAYHHWVTLDNPWIDPQEIEDAKRDLDERAFAQEYMATWETYDALAYYNFNDEIHVRAQPRIDPGKPLHLAFDFNVNPTTLLLSQYDGRVMRYKGEYSFNDSSTERTIEAFVADHSKDKDKLYLKIRGDAAGQQRKSTTGRTDYDYVRKYLEAHGFKFSYEVSGVNPPIIDRLKIVNGWLKPISGGHRIEIDPQCKELIKDLAGQKLDGRIPSDDGNRGHKADAMGYDIYWQWMVENRKPQGSVSL